MKKISSSIKTYWQKNSPAFSNQYKSLLGFPLSPVGAFLQARHKKITTILKALPGKTFLDVGCGSGIFIVEAINQGRQAIGIDYSKGMIETAQKNLKIFPKSSYTLIEADATALPCKSNSVDIILASGLTDYLTKAQVSKFFDEINRVLKKPGYAIVTFPKNDSPFAFLRNGLGLWLRKSFLHLPPMETAYSKNDILKFYHQANLKPTAWDEVLFTMRIGIAQKK